MEIPDDLFKLLKETEEILHKQDLPLREMNNELHRVIIDYNLLHNTEYEPARICLLFLAIMEKTDENNT